MTRFKIIQRFVTEKFILLMVVLLHKWFLLGWMAVMHPFFVSVTEINHNARDKVIEISCKTFTEDLENAIQKGGGAKMDLGNAKDEAAAGKLIGDYIKKHLQLKVDGKVMQLEFVGYEKENEAIWSYYQVSNVVSLKKLEVQNSILFEASDQEINLMHVTVGGVRKSTKLDYPNTAASFQY